MRVHLPFNPTTLTRGGARVHHDLGILTSEENNTDNPTGVPENGASKEHHRDVHRGLVFTLYNSSLQLVQVDVGLTTVDAEVILCIGDFLGRSEMGEGGTSSTRFEIGLSVQVLGLDKSDILLFGCSAYKDVGWYSLVIHDLYEITYANIFPCRHLPVRSFLPSRILSMDERMVVVVCSTFYLFAIIIFDTVIVNILLGRVMLLIGDSLRRSSVLQILNLSSAGTLFT